MRRVPAGDPWQKGGCTRGGTSPPIAGDSGQYLDRVGSGVDWVNAERFLGSLAHLRVANLLLGLESVASLYP